MDTTPLYLAAVTITNLDVMLSNPAPISEGQVNSVPVDVNIDLLKKKTQDVSGTGLWKLQVWGSLRADGVGQQISLSEQALTSNQEATPVERGAPFFFRNVPYELDMRGVSCSEINYVCVRIRKGNDPDPQFTFKGKPNQATTFSDCAPISECSGE